ncbi:MAG: purine-nucleoside phosphorylase [Bacteroidota bacterium]
MPEHPDPLESLPEIVRFLNENGIFAPIDTAVILGSGLGAFVDQIEESVSIPYSSIPHFPETTVAGHSGALMFGTIQHKTVLAFSGRFHHYEGHDFTSTGIPVQLASAFGCKKLIISNAAGGINLRFTVGDLMIIEDVIRLNAKLSELPTSPYRADLIRQADGAEHIARALAIDVKRGTYVYVKGPNYETKAEIKAYRTLGADAVGMSTVPEIMEAARLNLPVTAISLITNAAAGVTDQKLDHAEVKEAAELKKNEFAELVKGIILSN